MSATKLISACIAVGAICASPAALAQDFEFEVDTGSLQRTPIEIDQPGYPSSGVRRGQEGWVRVNFVITPDGRAIDPVILDSIGGVAFEKSLRDAMAKWRFEPAEQDNANITLDVRFERRRGRDRATSNFMRRYRRVMTHLYNEENPEARTTVDQAVGVGGWNLYESTMLWLMHGRVDGVEGNDAGKLESYRRALRVSNRNSLDAADRRDVLRKIFELEMQLTQYAHAAATLELLRADAKSADILSELAPLVADLEQQLRDAADLSASATIYNPSDDEQGTPLWSYRPARSSFSFAALNGNVNRFEVRCAHSRLQGLIEAGKTWELPEVAGNCRVFVFGEDGASFQFVEHADQDGAVTEPQAVTKSDVLD